jgi:hypothetical protein
VLSRVSVPACRAAILASIVGLSGCKSASTDACDPTDPLCGPTRVATSVTLAPDAVTLTSVGATQQLVPSVLDQNGQPINNATVSWSSDDQNVVTVSTSGLVRAVATGTTQVRATSGSAAAAVTASVCISAGTLAFGEVRHQSLAATDCRLVDGSYADFWTLNLTTAGSIQIDLLSGTFDTYLGLLDSEGEILGDSDDHDNPIGATFYDTSARIERTLGTGSHTIVATSYTPATTGSYQLSVGPGLPCPEEAVIALGTSTTGQALAGDDCTYDQYYADVYVVRISGSSVTATLTSANFDAYLTLLDPSGNIIQTDDDGGGGTNALISRSGMTPAWYVFEVSSAFQGETGNYTLTVN